MRARACGERAPLSRIQRLAGRGRVRVAARSRPAPGARRPGTGPVGDRRSRRRRGSPRRAPRRRCRPRARRPPAAARPSPRPSRAPRRRRSGRAAGHIQAFAARLAAGGDRARQRRAPAQVNGDGARVVHLQQHRPAQRRPPAHEALERRFAVAFVKVGLGVGDQLVPVLDVVALRGPGGHGLARFPPRPRRVVAQQPHGVGQADAQRRRGIDRAAVVGFLQPLGRGDPKPLERAQVVEALQREVPDGVQLPRGAHAALAKDSFGRRQMLQRRREPAAQVRGQAAHQRDDAGRVRVIELGGDGGRLCQQTLRAAVVPLRGGIGGLARDPARDSGRLARAQRLQQAARLEMRPLHGVHQPQPRRDRPAEIGARQVARRDLLGAARAETGGRAGTAPPAGPAARAPVTSRTPARRRPAPRRRPRAPRPGGRCESALRRRGGEGPWPAPGPAARAALR